MQRAAHGLVTAVFVLLLILENRSTPGGSGFLRAGEKAKSLSENRLRRGGPTGAGAPSPFVHKASQKGTVPDSSRKNEPVTPGTVITNTISMKLAYIPPGAFTMGSPLSEQEQFKKDNTDDWAAQEIQHEVSITNGF
jgi:formylglycine-generating enzyme required for sulfatase activity